MLDLLNLKCDDCANLIADWKSGYAHDMRKMKEMDDRELGYIRGMDYASDERLEFDIRELNARRKLYYINIIKGYADEASYEFRNVSSRLEFVRSQKSLMDAFLRLIGLDPIGSENQEMHKKYENDEPLLAQAKDALKTFEMEMYKEVEKFVELSLNGQNIS